VRRLIRWLRARVAPVPFHVVERRALEQGERDLFERSFGTQPPDFPWHFVAIHTASGKVCGYVHYTEHSPGIYLCGGLCVDARIYRQISRAERDAIAAKGSISRWLSDVSIHRLPAKRAVFAFTGNLRSRNDAIALGFVSAVPPHLWVQWHTTDAPTRRRLQEEVQGIGPF
jgi:hypothetical protein